MIWPLTSRNVWRKTGRLTSVSENLTIQSDSNDDHGKRAWARVAGRSKQERRNGTRRPRRALKKARITFKGRRATIDCTVLNLSDLGACLKVKSPMNSRCIRSCALQRTRPQLPRDLAERSADWCCVRLGDFPGFALPAVRPAPAHSGCASRPRRALSRSTSQHHARTFHMI